MQKSQLFKYFESIKPTEWRTFEKYLFSRISEKSESGRLYQYIKANRKRISKGVIDIDKANTTLFKNKSRKNFSNLMSVLVGHFKSYFIHLQLDQKELLQNALLIEELNNRNLYEEAANVYFDTEKKENKWKLGLMNHMYKKMIYHKLYFSYNPIKESKEGVELFEKNIVFNVETFDGFNAMHELEKQNRAINKRLSRKNVKESTNQVNIADLYNNMGELFFDHDNVELFDKMQELFYSQSTHWDEELQNLGYQAIKSHILHDMKLGIKGLESLVEFAKFCWKEEQLKIVGFYNLSNTITIYEAAWVANDIDFANEVYERIKYERGGKIDDNYIQLLNAIRFFIQGESTKALEIFNSLSKLDRMEKLVIRRWQMVCLAEVFNDDYNFLQSHYINYNSFFNRTKHKYSNLIIESSMNFAKLWKLCFLDKNYEEAQSMLAQSIPITKRYFFQKKIRRSELT